ncbi:High-affinity branched-chain amino acid transport system permease protein BraE [Magnetospirillum sp. UT-4]|nr:High-affinity branched-chain amino acid transport system permease protein BraE [Magnetospirillum sp. UT-4]
MAAAGGEVRRNAIDAVIGGLVAAALALPLLGFRLVDSAQGLSLGFRFDLVLWAALAVAAGRFALGLLGGVLGRHPLRPPEALIGPLSRSRPWLGWAMIAFAALLPLLPFADRNLIDKATLVLIYVMLGWGLNIVVGLAGLLDLGFVAFYAVGAYSYALLAVNFGWSFWICLPLAGLLAAGFGIALGFPVLRLRGDYLAIVTLGFGEIIRVVLQNWQDLTNGPQGISGIPRPSLFGLRFAASAPEGETTFAEFFGIAFAAEHRVTFLYFVILALALATNLFALRIRRLPIGRAWEALREDEIACRSLGLNPTTVKLSAFATGAMFAGFAGSFFATRQGFISPESFTFIESAVILAIVVLGGMGSQIGVVLAALLLVGLPEWFRDLQQYRMVAFGGAMVLIMLWRPSGLLASRNPTVRLHGGSR